LLDGYTALCYSRTMEQDVWIAAFAHRLLRHWRNVHPDELDQVAADLWRDARLREMDPVEAAEEWLKPIATRNVPPQPL
jgi:hypothetical protein